MRRCNTIIESKLEPENKYDLWIKDKKLKIFLNGVWEDLVGESLETNEEDLSINDSGKLELSNRNYNPEVSSGKGYKILRKYIPNNVNILNQEMINEENTIYEIRYDFDLNNQEIIIPKGCILKFEGGSLSNGIIIGNDTYFYEDLITYNNNILLKGTWTNINIRPEWFGAKGDGTTNDFASIWNAVECMKDNNKTIVFQSNKQYYVEAINNEIVINPIQYMNGIKLHKGVNIEGNGCTFLLYKTMHLFDTAIYSTVFSDNKFLTEDVIDTNILHLENVDGLKIGDRITIYGEDQQGEDKAEQQNWEFNTIESIDIEQKTITLVEKVSFNILLANCGQTGSLSTGLKNGSIYVNNDILSDVYIQNFNVRNLEAPSFQYGSVVYVTEGHNVHIKNIQTNKEYPSSLVTLYRVSNATINDMSIIQRLDTIHNVFNLYNVKQCSINNIYAENVRGNIIGVECSSIGIKVSNMHVIAPSTGRCCIAKAVYGSRVLINDLVLSLPVNYNRELIIADYIPTGSIKINNLTLTNVIVDDNKYLTNIPTILWKDVVGTVSFICNSVTEDFIVDANTLQYDILIDYDKAQTLNSNYLHLPFIGEIKQIIIQSNVNLSGAMAVYNVSEGNDTQVWYEGSIKTNTIYSPRFTSNNRAKLPYKIRYLATNELQQGDYIKLSIVYSPLLYQNNYINRQDSYVTNDFMNISTIGEYLNKPINVSIGFKYYCTDKQSPESSTYGLIIYHKGNNIWVDSLGRVVDVNYPKLIKGTTSQRPVLTYEDEGFEYYDSTIKKKILWNGESWVNLDGSTLI